MPRDYTYVAQRPSSRRFKIGDTDNPPRRLGKDQKIAFMADDELFEPIAIVPKSQYTQDELHKLFENRRVPGRTRDLFDLTDENIDLLCSMLGCQALRTTPDYDEIVQTLPTPDKDPVMRKEYVPHLLTTMYEMCLFDDVNTHATMWVICSNVALKLTLTNADYQIKDNPSEKSRREGWAATPEPRFVCHLKWIFDQCCKKGWGVRHGRDSWKLTVEGLRHVELNNLVSPETIKRVRKLHLFLRERYPADHYNPLIDPNGLYSRALNGEFG